MRTALDGQPQLTLGNVLKGKSLPKPGKETATLSKHEIEEGLKNPELLNVLKTHIMEKNGITTNPPALEYDGQLMLRLKAHTFLVKAGIIPPSQMQSTKHS